MFRPLSPGHHQVTSKRKRKLDTVIYKNGFHRLKMQRDLVVVILYGSIYTTVYYGSIDTTVQNNDNEISLHFKPIRNLFMNYSV